MTAAAAPEVLVGLRRRARLLVWATIGWNTVEAVIALGAGAAAGSGALVSFGLDSTVEVSAAVVALWYLRGDSDVREERAGKLIALSFWALALWVAFDAGSDLVTGDRPDASTVGIVLTATSVVVMPALGTAKRRTGRQLGSAALVAESNETMVCAYLSVAVLAGLRHAPRVAAPAGSRPTLDRPDRAHVGEERRVHLRRGGCPPVVSHEFSNVGTGALGRIVVGDPGPEVVGGC